MVIGGGVSGNARIYFGAMLRANLVISNSSVANVSSIRSRRASIPGTPSAGRSARWALVFFDCSRNSRRSWQWSQAGDPGSSSQQTHGPVNFADFVMGIPFGGLFPETQCSVARRAAVETTGSF